MTSLNWSERLRQHLLAQATTYATTLPPDTSFLSLSGSVRLFTPFDGGQKHGNFCDLSYAAIVAEDRWKERLNKPHPRRSNLPSQHNLHAHELDSSNSSDALLMNVFCFPGIVKSGVGDLLNVSYNATPEFGFRAQVPLLNGNFDKSEVDLKLDDVLIEAKLTEKGFTQQSEAIVRTYRDLDAVFDVAALPRHQGEFESYQLIRNVLAAHHHNSRFFLLCDARRPDLLKAWCEVYAAIKSPSLQGRCGFILWQQLAFIAPLPLSEYLRLSRAIG